MIEEMIASRTLKTKHRITGEIGELSVEIHRPYLLKEGMVDFPIHAGVSGCSVRVVGLGTDQYDQEVYGGDTLQVLQLASDVEGMLKHISQSCELFFKDGEPYFEPENT